MLMPAGRQSGPRTACRFRDPRFDVWMEPGDGRPPSPLRGGNPMRFMIIVKADKNSEAGVMPSTELIDRLVRRLTSKSRLSLTTSSSAATTTNGSAPCSPS